MTDRLSDELAALVSAPPYIPDWAHRVRITARRQRRRCMTVTAAACAVVAIGATTSVLAATGRTREPEGATTTPIGDPSSTESPTPTSSASVTVAVEPLGGSRPSASSPSPETLDALQVTLRLQPGATVEAGTDVGLEIKQEGDHWAAWSCYTGQPDCGKQTGWVRGKVKIGDAEFNERWYSGSGQLDSDYGMWSPYSTADGFYGVHFHPGAGTYEVVWYFEHYGGDGSVVDVVATRSITLTVLEASPSPSETSSPSASPSDSASTS